MAMCIFLGMVALCVVVRGSSNSDDSNSPNPGQRQPQPFNWVTKEVSEELRLTEPPNGGEMYCSATDCKITAVGTPGFMWSDSLRRAAQPVNLSGWPSPDDDNRSVSQEQTTSCHAPQKVVAMSKSPFKYMARILFKGKDGKYGWCTGSFIQTGLVLTAGHCCYTTPSLGKVGWHSDYEVVLEYGTTHNKSYGVKHITVNKLWHNNDWSHDYCFLTTASSARGHIGWKHGYRPSSFHSITSYGYATNYGKGEVMYKVTGPYHSKSHTGNSTAGVFQMSCNPMHSGNSGGPWLVHQHVIGLNSYHEGDKSTHEHSPYFGKDWLTSCQHAGGCKTYTQDGGVLAGPASTEEVVIV